jgi:hypothetical protein
MAMAQKVDLDQMLKLVDELEERSGTRGGSGKNTRVDEDADVIAQILAARSAISTSTLIGVFQKTFSASKEAAKTRVSLALRKLVSDNRATKLKQGLYCSSESMANH